MTQPTLTDRLRLRQRPTGRPALRQRWQDLLFLHWAVEPELIQRTLPPGLTVDTFEGRAYLGIVPFFMRGIRPNFLPPIPGISNFLETNVRTYVYDAHGAPGVWFYSLEANQGLAIWVARTFYKLPYWRADMRARLSPVGLLDYHVQRRGTQTGSRFCYAARGDIFSAEPDTLAFFLVERYLLYAATGRGLAAGQVYHTPYPIQSAQVEAWDAHLLTLNHFTDLQRPPDHALYSPGVNVEVFPLRLPTDA